MNNANTVVTYEIKQHGVRVALVLAADRESAIGAFMLTADGRWVSKWQFTPVAGPDMYSVVDLAAETAKLVAVADALEAQRVAPDARTPAERRSHRDANLRRIANGLDEHGDAGE